jgi:hypothetical protein
MTLLSAARLCITGGAFAGSVAGGGESGGTVSTPGETGTHVTVQVNMMTARDIVHLLRNFRKDIIL